MKMWSAPLAVVEQFMSNEYISSCTRESETQQYVKFVCDAGGGVNGDVWQSSLNFRLDANDCLTKDENGATRYYHACNITHYVPADSVEEMFASKQFIRGYYTQGYDNDSESITQRGTEVVVWMGDGHVHCTNQLTNFEIVNYNLS